MADKLTPKQRSANMARIRSKDMKPEMIVRRLVYALGYRYRLHRKNLPGKPDIVFAKYHKVIFVHGCFWHQHDNPNCLDGSRRKPKSNTSYWNLKLSRNVERDLKNQMYLKQVGWDILVIWECETRDHVALSVKLKKFLENE